MSEQEINTMAETTESTPGVQALLHVYAAVAAVMEEVQGIAKSGRVTGPGMNYTYRKADDVVEDLGAAFRRHKLFLQSRVMRSEDRQTTTTAEVKGSMKTTTWNRRMVVMQYRITSLVDGSCLTVESTGEGLDNSDKASNKAMTSAIKYALTQGFMISTSDMNDPDEERPAIETDAARMVRERRAQEQAAQQPAAAAPAPEVTPAADRPAEASAASADQEAIKATQANAEREATRALTEAAKQAVQADERGDAPVFEPEQLERAGQAHTAAIKGDRHKINRIIVAAKTEGLMHAKISGTPLHMLLMTLREVAPNDAAVR